MRQPTPAGSPRERSEPDGEDTFTTGCDDNCPLDRNPGQRDLIGGGFTTVNGVSRNRVARLEADGSLDTTFLNGLAGLNNIVQSLAVQPDGRVLIGGGFTTVYGVSRNFVARLYGSAPVAPIITVEPAGQASYDGCCAVFHVTAAGTPLDYRWRKDGVDLVDGGNVSGAFSPTLTVCGLTPADEGDYSVVVGNVLGSDTSADAELTVDAAPTFYGDADGDRWGDPLTSAAACYAPAGYVSNSLDCDDTDPSVEPGGAEACDGQRNDCNDPNWPALLDADMDGTEDACESCIDGDSDGWGDPGNPGNLCADDNCPADPNPDQADPDYDGLGTACDTCPLDDLNDEDGDGVCGDADNCPQDANPGQENADGDALGDVCDACPNDGSGNNDDLDMDGLSNACDPDVDGDGILNEDDVNDDGDSVPDDDGDGIFDPCPDLETSSCDDNCPLDRNSNQRDRDGDGIGDACDTSDDIVHGGGAGQGGGGSPFTDSGPPYDLFVWEPEVGAIAYTVYAGTLADLHLDSYGACYRNRIVTTYTVMDHEPVPGTGVFYLVAPVFLEGEGSVGDRSDHTERLVASACP